MRARKVFEEARLKIVQEALSGIKVAVLARKYEIHPETIRTWVKEYRDRIGDDQIPSTDE
ncbi:helix-turn-helix domain-containing protein, partial [Paenibacillus radicis (ex Xue et al. 2023)]